MTLQDWDSTFAIAGVVVAAAIAIHFRVIRPAQKTLKSLLSLLPVSELIKAEFSPNGGLSLKDTINRIDKEVHVLKFHDRLSQDLDERAILEFDHCGYCVYVNDAASRLLSYSHETDWIGNSWVSVVKPKERVETLTTWFESVKFGLQSDICCDTEHGRVRLTARPIFGSGERLLGYFCLAEKEQ